MQKNKIIACLDINNGKVVKGINFVDIKEVGDPVKNAIHYYNEGADEIVFLNINPTKENTEMFLDIIRQVSKCVDVPLIAGGGINSLEHIQKHLDAGIDKVSVGSAAYKNPDFIKQAVNKFGNDKIIVAVDVKKNDDKYDLYISGATINTNEDAIKFALKMQEFGACAILPTSIDRDGKKDGYDNEMYKAFTDVLNIPVIASGGAGKISDFYDVFNIAKVYGALAASVFHYNEIKIKDIKQFLAEHIELKLKFDAQGLISVIVQDFETKEVLMMAYMNNEAYDKTLETGKAHYFSRSRNKLWLKGEQSSNFQFVKDIFYDCDCDCLLLLVEQVGGACHTGHKSCFYRNIKNEIKQDVVFDPNIKYNKNILKSLSETIKDRKLNPVPKSYTNYLFDKGIDKILKKVGEECSEVIIASKNTDKNELIYEASDLIYHLTVLFEQKNISWDDIFNELKKREE